MRSVFILAVEEFVVEEYQKSLHLDVHSYLCDSERNGELFIFESQEDAEKALETLDMRLVSGGKRGGYTIAKYAELNEWHYDEDAEPSENYIDDLHDTLNFYEEIDTRQSIGI